MDTDEITAKELKERKDFSLSASTGERAGVRCRNWSFNHQFSTSP
jgi:hypothetical protein